MLFIFYGSQHIYSIYYAMLSHNLHDMTAKLQFCYSHN